jgi:hypothetical protein
LLVLLLLLLLLVQVALVPLVVLLLLLCCHLVTQRGSAARGLPKIHQEKQAPSVLLLLLSVALHSHASAAERVR